MFRIEMNNRPLTDEDEVRKFRVSHDCQRAALVTGNKILFYKLIQRDASGQRAAFSNPQQFKDSTQVIDIPTGHQDVNDIFIFQNKLDGSYGLYVASKRGVVMFRSVEVASGAYVPHTEVTQEFK